MLQRIKPNYVNWDPVIPSGISVQGVINMGSNYVEKVGDLSIVSGNVSINLSSASAFTLNLTSDVTNVEITDYPSTSDMVSFVLIVTADGTERTITWPNSFKWPNGDDPLITSENGKKDVFCFFTLDNGTSWQSIISGQNL
jgi:hypothetical protein